VDIIPRTTPLVLADAGVALEQHSVADEHPADDAPVDLVAVLVEHLQLGTHRSAARGVGMVLQFRGVAMETQLTSVEP